MTHRLRVERHLPPATLSLLSQVVVAVLGPSTPESEVAARRRALIFVLPKVLWPSAAVSPAGQAGPLAQRILRDIMRGSQSAALTKIDAPPLACQLEHCLGEASSQPPQAPRHVIPPCWCGAHLPRTGTTPSRTSGMAKQWTLEAGPMRC